MSANSRPALAQTFRRAALPLGWYYAVTLALPLANGAGQAGAAFVDHALIVLVVPPILIVLLHVVHVLIRSPSIRVIRVIRGHPVREILVKSIREIHPCNPSV